MEITIRHTESQDAEQIKRILDQPSCYASTFQLPYSSMDQWREKFEKRPPGFYSLVAEINGEIAGEIGMKVQAIPRRQHVAEIGMAVSESYQGKGVGSRLMEAMLNLAENWLAVRRVELEVYTDNHAAIKLYKKFGFKMEGTAIGYAFRDGEYVDAHSMARVHPSLSKTN